MDIERSSRGRGVAQEDEGYSFYERVASDVGGNIAFAFIGLGAIWLLAKLWLLGAKGLFWLETAVVALGVLHFVIVLSAGVISHLMGALMRAPLKNARWVWGAAAARFIEQLGLLAALWIAARVVGYLP